MTGGNLFMWDSIVAFISQPAVLATLAFVLEVLMRVIKTDKPVSILRLISAVLKGVVKVLLAVDGLVDKLIPNNTVPAPAPEEPAK